MQSTQNGESTARQSQVLCRHVKPRACSTRLRDTPERTRVCSPTQETTCLFFFATTFPVGEKIIPEEADVAGTARGTCMPPSCRDQGCRLMPTTDFLPIKKSTLKKLTNQKTAGTKCLSPYREGKSFPPSGSTSPTRLLRTRPT